jgi:formyltetrahydrofolate deformylase
VRFVSKRGTVARFRALQSERAHIAHRRVPICTSAGANDKSPIGPVNAIVRSRRDHPGIADQPDTSRLLLACPDQPGLIAAVSGFLADAGRNIIDADQHSSREGRLFMRMVFDPAPEGEREALHRRFEDEVAGPLQMEHRFAESSDRKRVAIMVSREDHCLSDLLWRWRSGELGAEVVAVVSNHPDHADQVASLGLPYHHIPIGDDGREAAEAEVLELLGGGIDLLVLARYMQILSAGFLGRLGAPAINIHHSFLPAFIGADPYARAHERGVKLIGATAHYVTEDLDAGPIIDQDVTRVSHRDEVEDLMRIGRDIERLVLARAVAAHLDDRVLLDGDRTIVF